MLGPELAPRFWPTLREFCSAELDALARWAEAMPLVDGPIQQLEYDDAGGVVPNRTEALVDHHAGDGTSRGPFGCSVVQTLLGILCMETFGESLMKFEIYAAASG